MNHSNSLLVHLRNTDVSKLLLPLAFLLLPILVYGQRNKGQLEKEKVENLRKIAEAEKILTETQSERRVNVGQLQALNQQIKARESLIDGLTEEISLLDGEIHDLSIVVIALQQDLKDLKDEYAEMIYASYKANSGFNILTFLFSAETFNQLYMRLKYLEQYSDARQLQVEQIQVVTEELTQQLSDVEIKRDEQRGLLDDQVKESRKLQKLKNQKSSLVAELTKKEGQLRREVTNRKKAIDQLDATIANIVRRDLETDDSPSAVSALSMEEVNASFEKRKNKLNWPVASGFISKKFGNQPHPVLKRIRTENNGIDIQTNQQEVVRSVFDGEVKMVGYLQGMNNFVMVKHGNYFTVYSRLKNVTVEKGQSVRAMDEIGEVFTDGEGTSELHFEVWKNTTKLNPEKWLRN